MRALLGALALVAGLVVAPSPAHAVGGTCDPATRGQVDNVVELSIDNANVLISTHFGWDGVSVRPDCDGPVISIRTQNVSDLTYWATLPNKKKGGKAIEIPPHTDTTITSGGTLNSLGLTNFSDVAGVGLTTVQPAIR